MRGGPHRLEGGLTGGPHRLEVLAGGPLDAVLLASDKARGGRVDLVQVLEPLAVPHDLRPYRPVVLAVGAGAALAPTRDETRRRKPNGVRSIDSQVLIAYSVASIAYSAAQRTAGRGVRRSIGRQAPIPRRVALIAYCA
eukprot:1195253-Prorocentrum_minimum.AAC.5